jgi:hypothetical protein
MAAGLGFKTFTTGEVLTAADTNGYLMQGVLVFASSAARSSAVTSPQEGQYSYLKDTNSTEYYDGAAWVSSGSVPTSYGYTAGKNKIINGDFYVNQRAFTTSTTSGTYGFDRFRQSNSGGTATQSAQTFTAGAAPVAGYEGKNFVRMVTASQSAAGDYAGIVQSIEDVRSFAGQSITVSFWAKASTGTPNIGIATGQNFGSGGSATVITSPAVQAITSSWVRYSFAVAIPSISGKTIGTSSLLDIGVWTSVGTTLSGLGYPAVGVQNVTIDIWGVQAEVGSTATAFQTATGTIQGELAACQRYYVYDSKAAVNVYQANGANAWGNYIFPVPMRVAPTITQTGGAIASQNTSATTFTTDTSNNNTLHTGIYFLTGASATTSYLYRIVEWSAEL